ncbi:MAG: glycosyltransferase [Cyanobacteria bacterium J06632_22]
MSKPLNVLQIVPRLTPDVDGVGDYALCLAQQLLPQGITAEFLVVRPSQRTPPAVDGFPVHRLGQHTLEGFLAQVPQGISTVLLHYSNYPYLLGKLDTPDWLAAGLDRLKQRGLRIVVMFHELPTLRYRGIRCPNWLQRRLSRRLAKLADQVITNNTAFQQVLNRWTSEPVVCVPNFSTVGEPKWLPPLRDRNRSLIVFGSSDRGRIYHPNTSTLQTVCQQLNIHTLYDIGRPVDWDASSLPPQVNVVKTGFLPAAALSQLLTDAIAGLFDYQRFPQNLAKSTVYAAYCAHGLLPICNRRSLPYQDGIRAGQHYLATPELQTLTQQTSDLTKSLQIIASSAHNQYRSRTLSTCTGMFADLLLPTALAAPSMPLLAPTAVHCPLP